MRSYNDLTEIGDSDARRMDFIQQAIAEHKATDAYKTALDAEQYMKTQNPTIMKYKKLLYTISGEAVPDNYSANHKCASSFFKRFVTQENQYLLGNGVTFAEESTKEKLGGDDFDVQIQKLGRDALVGGLSFAFANLDHIDTFKLTEFVPLWDDEDGSLKAGIRFWQVAYNKPLRATLYEIDGYTEYIKRKDEDMQIFRAKTPYKVRVAKSVADGVYIIDGQNYPTFPIVPLWGNPEHQSELMTIRSQIDAYDLIKSGFANDLDDASMIYWTISNAGGMDDVDLAKFVERMKTVKAAVVGDGISGGTTAEAHTMDVPYASREAYLSRLEADMYKDFMALNVEQIAAGQVTATQIDAAYEPLNEKADMFEYCVNECIKGILTVFGIDDKPSFVRSKMSNVKEDIEALLAGADYLSEDYITRKLLTLLGDVDLIEDVMNQRANDGMSRMTGGDE
jgi:SPP1 family phage portal protein